MAISICNPIYLVQSNLVQFRCRVLSIVENDFTFVPKTGKCAWKILRRAITIFAFVIVMIWYRSGFCCVLTFSLVESFPFSHPKNACFILQRIKCCCFYILQLHIYSIMQINVFSSHPVLFKMDSAILSWFFY